MTPTERLILENQKAIMDFLLYPNSPDYLIAQKNKIDEALNPPKKEGENYPDSLKIESKGGEK